MLARLIAEVRENARLSQSELARRLRRRQAFVWKLENCLQIPSLVELSDISAATGTDLLELVRKFKLETANVLPESK